MAAPTPSSMSDRLIDVPEAPARPRVMCECGCGRPAEPGSKYAKRSQCSQRVYRRKLQARLAAAGQPTRLSLRLVEEAGPTQSRIGDSDRRHGVRHSHRRDGVQIYIRDPQLAELMLDELERIVNERGKDVLRPAAVAIAKGLLDRAQRIKRRAEQPAAAPVPHARVDIAAPAGRPVPCPGCRGSGTCPTCHGEGTVPAEPENGQIVTTVQAQDIPPEGMG